MRVVARLAGVAVLAVGVFAVFRAVGVPLPSMPLSGPRRAAATAVRAAEPAATKRLAVARIAVTPPRLRPTVVSSHARKAVRPVRVRMRAHRAPIVERPLPDLTVHLAVAPAARRPSVPTVLSHPVGPGNQVARPTPPAPAPASPPAPVAPRSGEPDSPPRPARAAAPAPPPLPPPPPLPGAPAAIVPPTPTLPAAPPLPPVEVAPPEGVPAPPSVPPPPPLGLPDPPKLPKLP
jgi:hypothetical protein